MGETVTPLIVCQSTGKDEATASFELRRRGFIVVSYKAEKDEGAAILLELSPKLIFNALLNLRLPNADFNELSSLHKHLVMNYALEVLRNSKAETGYQSAWVPHNKQCFSHILNSKTTSSKLEAIFHYFGPEISFYFAWLANYTTNLQVPAVAGLLVFAQQWYTKDIDSALMPFYAILIALWGTYFLEFWKRESNSLGFRWKVLGAEEDEMDLELAKAAEKEKSDNLVRLSLSSLGTVSIIYVMFNIMLYYVDRHIRSEEIYGKDSYMRYYPLAVYSILPCLLPVVFEPIAIYLNNYEQHTTKAEVERNLVFKKFALQFVNKYSALLYVAFWRRDLDMLRSLLISLLTTGAIINNGLELGAPYIAMVVKFATSFLAKKKSSAEESAAGSSKGGSKEIVPKTPSPPAPKPTFSLSSMFGGSASQSEKEESGEEGLKILLMRELGLQEYTLDDDYLEMVLQFGFVTMFAVVFPLTPLLALLNNLVESRVDITKLGQCRRSHVKIRSNIGAWQTCLEALSFMAVLTNCYILAMASNKLSILVPSSFHGYLDSDYGRLMAMLALEHVLFGAKLLMMSIIDDVPRRVQEALARERVTAKEKEVQQRIEKYQRKSTKAEDDEDNGEDANDDKEEEDEKVDGSLEEAEALRRLNNTLASPFSFNPLSVSALVAMPLALHYSSLSPYLYIPLSVIFLSYYQNMKDRMDRKAAAGIVSDPQLLTFVQQEMPSWLSDSEFQRVEWFNSTLQTLWPQIILAVEKLVSEQVQPILEKSKPALLTTLKLSRCCLGSTAPKIAGIRFIHAGATSVRLDVEVRFTGDSVISLKVGTAALPALVVELADIDVTAVVRVELLDLIPRIPCFTALSITCMKKPSVNFSLKLAGLDIMNLGAGEYNIMSLVRSTIHNALASTLIFPKRIIVKMDKESDTNYAEAQPVAILVLKVESAQNLRSAHSLMGSLGSDPYVEIKCAHQIFRTATKSMTLNPTWNESFEVMVYDLSTQVVDFEVRDSEVAASETVLGTASVNISTLPSAVELTKTLLLATGETKSTKSSLTVKLSLKILQSNKTADGKSGNKQRGRKGFAGCGDVILYDKPAAELTDEMLRNDPGFSKDEEAVRNSFSNKSDKRGALWRSMQAVKATNALRMDEGYPGVLQISHIKARGLKAPSGMSSWLDSSF
eukprot:gene26837-32435_t